ncbi:MAG: lytic transglycosylase domain-containing protein [Bosea sp. (in: a-proteobacteria)]
MNFLPECLMFLFTTKKTSEAQVLPQKPHAQPLADASKATGISFDYLAKTAERESGFNATAKASTSSATGLFQFIEQTWLGMVKSEGAKFGLGQEAAAISSDGGKFAVTDPAMRQKILALREDPAASAKMAGAFASRNGQSLQQALGRSATEGELYVAHFLGAGGAKDLIQLAQSNPEAKAATFFRDAAAANRSIFFDKAGKARSAGEVYSNLTGSFSSKGPTVVQETAATRDTAHQMFRVKGTGQPMHGLFRSDGEPVAGAVKDTWAKMGRRSMFSDDGASRVAFYPADTGVGRTIASDARPAGGNFIETARQPTNVALPPRRPASAELLPNALPANAMPARKSPRAAKPASQPLDLMRFVKTG